MAFSLVQHSVTNFGAVSSASATFGSATAINNRSIVGTGVFPHTITISSVADNGTTPNTYNSDNVNFATTNVDATSDTRSANVATNPSSGNLSVTVTLSGTASGGDIFLEEVSGLGTAANIVDVKGTVNTQANVTSDSVSTSANCTATGEYPYALLLTASGTSFTAGSGTTVDDGDNTNNMAQGHVTAGSTNGQVATANFSWTTASSDNGMITVYKLAAAVVASIVLPNPRRRRNILPTAHSRVQMVPAPITVAPPPLAYIPAGGRRRFFLASRRVRLALPLAMADALPPPVRRRQQLPSIRRRLPALPVLDQVLMLIARRRASVARVIRRRSEFPWFQATVPPPPIWIPEGRKNRALRFWRRRWIRNEFPWFQALLPVTGPKLPPAIASGIQAAIASPRSAPMATPGQAPVAQPRSGAIATPVQTPKIIN